MQANPITIIIDKSSKYNGVLPVIVISNFPIISEIAKSVDVHERIIPKIPVIIIDIIIATERFSNQFSFYHLFPFFPTFYITKLPLLIVLKVISN